jgi:hypothetical protein
MRDTRSWVVEASGADGGNRTCPAVKVRMGTMAGWFQSAGEDPDTSTPAAGEALMGTRKPANIPAANKGIAPFIAYVAIAFS